jgi:hypothetical protein
MTEAMIGGFSFEVLYDERPPGSMDGTLDGRYVFWFEPMPDGHIRAWINGHRGEPFDELLKRADGSPWLISSAGGRFAYVGQRAKQVFVGADDREYGPYQNLSRQIEPFFSPDDRHLVFGVVVGGDVRLVVDGSQLPGVRPAAGRPVFSPDGSRFAYTAARRDSVVHEWVVLDDVADPESDGIGEGSMVFSPDSRHFAYAREANSRWEYVVDGDAGPAFMRLELGVFNADGSRFAFPASDGGRWFLVEDGRAGPSFERVSSPIFSPDGSRLAYVGAESKTKMHVVVDGHIGPAWHDLWDELAFSADGRRFAYIAQEVTGGPLRRQTAWRPVIDGASRRSFDEIASSPRFSPDGQVAFAGRTGPTWFMVVDDEPGLAFDGVGPPVWSATGRLAYTIRTGGEMAVVVDGTVGPRVSRLSDSDGKFIWFSPDGQHVVYLGVVGDSLHAVVDGRFGPPTGGLAHPTFTADSVSFLGLRDDRVVRLHLPLD